MCTAQAVPSLARGKRGALDLIPSGVRKGPLIFLDTALRSGPSTRLVPREAPRQV